VSLSGRASPARQKASHASPLARARGCQCSIACDIRKHVPESTLPVFPESISSRARRPAAPRNVSGADPSLRGRLSLGDERASMFGLGAERFLAEDVFSRTKRGLTYHEVRGGRRPGSLRRQYLDLQAAHRCRGQKYYTLTRAASSRTSVQAMSLRSWKTAHVIHVYAGDCPAADHANAECHFTLTTNLKQSREGDVRSVRRRSACHARRRIISRQLPSSRRAARSNQPCSSRH